MITQTRRVIKAFPALPNTFVDLLLERAKEKCFSDERLREAVNHVIDTCQYPTPTLANFLSFDKRVKIYSYNEVCNLVANGESFKTFFRMTVKGKPFYVRAVDKELYNLQSEL